MKRNTFPLLTIALAFMLVAGVCLQTGAEERPTSALKKTVWRGESSTDGQTAKAPPVSLGEASSDGSGPGYIIG